MRRLVQIVFFCLVVRPLLLLVIGLRVRRQENLPKGGPAIIIANHNSHLDTLVLMNLFPLQTLERLRPVAAQDYFFSNPLLKWIALNLIHIIPIVRGRIAAGLYADKLGPISDALARGEIVIFFPEGSCGEPEQMTKFHSGIAKLAERHSDCPIIPVYLNGLGKALPKGDFLLVRFFCDVVVGSPRRWADQQGDFALSLEKAIYELEVSLDLPRRQEGSAGGSPQSGAEPPTHKADSKLPVSMDTES